MVNEISPSSIWLSLTEKYLASNMYETALFYAERLHYENRSPESLYMLALVYYRMGKIKQTYLILQGSKNSTAIQNKYLFALACVALHKYEEAETVLYKDYRLAAHDKIVKDCLQNKIPGGAEGVYLMGKICRRLQRMDSAAHFYKLALQVSPCQHFYIDYILIYIY